MRAFCLERLSGDDKHASTDFGYGVWGLPEQHCGSGRSLRLERDLALKTKRRGRWATPLHYTK
jgi:hypothetical protein